MKADDVTDKMRSIVLACVIGYMLTWNTYGRWLQGDERGYVKNGQSLGCNAKLKKANQSRMVGSAFRLDEIQKTIVRNQILETAKRMAHTFYAVSVCSNHVHIVASSVDETIGEIVRMYKRETVYALRKEGVEGNVWARGYDKRFCYNEGSLQARIEYVRGHYLD
ncbi:MAG: hypothetical protein FVQ79_14150 [Planctomycetes bacterium]|nr:hypothetical protein [Planctomycetota bacterium]